MMFHIPEIDISSLHDGSEASFHKVGGKLSEAAQEIGFFYISGHGIEPSIIDSAFEIAEQFFLLPRNKKIQVRVSDSHRGFLSIGESTMEGYQGADQKESYIWGLDFDGSGQFGQSLSAPNRWPTEMPQMRTVLRSYFDAIHQCSFKLLRAAAVSLGQDDRFFVEHFNQPTSRGSLIYYPPKKSAGNDYGVSPHTDFGCISVLAQRSRGLQVQAKNGEWFKVDPIAGTLVVNIGDLLTRWTNGRFRSVPHCVINEETDARFSVVVFVDPDSKTTISPILNSGESPRYEAVECETYITGRFNRSFAYRH